MSTESSNDGGSPDEGTPTLHLSPLG
jgi:hypothetical protein